MKYLKYITLVAFLAFAVSCSKDDDEGNMPPEPTPPVEKQIGRASCRERV